MRGLPCKNINLPKREKLSKPTHCNLCKVELTPEEFKEFKKQYFKALYKQQEFFMFNNKQIFTDFGKYVVKKLTPKYK